MRLIDRFEQYCLRQQRKHALDLVKHAARYAGRVGFFHLERDLIRAAACFDKNDYD